MLNLQLTLENLEQVRKALLRRNASAAEGLTQIETEANLRRKKVTELESLRANRNAVSAEMAKLPKNSPDFSEKRDAMREVGAQIAQLEKQVAEVEENLERVLLGIPNLPHESTPDGQNDSANREMRTWGMRPDIGFTPRDHVEIGLGLGIFDFDRAAKISGSRFTVLRSWGARLERALLNFMVDLHTSRHGYTEMWPPALVLDSALRGTGQLPKFEEDVFRIAPGKHDDAAEDHPRKLYLVPTAEVPITNLHAAEILSAESLPIAYAAYSPCFRSEAGSYGKDTRGLIRQHQFDKVELVRFVRPENGLAELELLTAHAEQVLRELDLHYRVVELCAGDLGFSSRKTYDLEVWLPGQNAYREISSCSWFGDFQARRAGIRYRPEGGGKPEFVHTLNGSGLAIGRTLVAILEQYQNADGSVRIPVALRPYLPTLSQDGVIRAES